MPSSEEWRWTKHNIVAGSLAFVGGYADVISLHRWNCFATMTTGNTIWLGRVLFGHNVDNGELHSAVFYFCIILAFFFGVVLHRLGDLRWPNRGGSRVSPWLALVSLTCEIVYVVLDKEWEQDYLKWTVVLYSPLFGVVCAACADGRLGSATTMVTGHIISLGKGLANSTVKEFAFAEKCKFALSITVIICSILGACVGAQVHKGWLDNGETRGLFLPVPVLITVLLWLHDHLARPRLLLKKLKKMSKRQAAEAGNPAEDAASTSSDDGDDAEDDEGDSEESVDVEDNRTQPEAAADARR